MSVAPHFWQSFTVVSLLSALPINIERAIELELQNTVQSGHVIDSDKFTAYRFWQKGGEIVAGTILGFR